MTIVLFENIPLVLYAVATDNFFYALYLFSIMILK